MSEIKHTTLKESALILRAYAHPLRLQIISFIDKQRSVNVNKIYKSLGLEQSITSQHLRILRNAGIVKTEREGKMIHYSIDYDSVQKTMTSLRKFIGEG